MKHVITDDEVKKREALRIELIEKMKECEVTNSELAEKLGMSIGAVVHYRRGSTVLTKKTHNRLMKAIQEIVDHRNKPRGPIVIPEEEIQKRIDRRSILNEEMSKNDISDKELATHAKMDKSTIEKYRNGSYSITRMNWDILTTALESIRLKRRGITSTYDNNPVIIEKRCNHSTKYVEAYVFRNIEEKGNALITKKKFKGREEHILNDLREFGYECSVRELKDGSYILEGRKINA